MPRPYSVLLVEDDDPLRQILAELLQERGFKIFSTDRGHQAVEMALRVRPDFGLFDMHLRGSTGLEALLSIQQQLGPMPSIMMSGEATKSETEAALQAGVFRFLRKPIGLDLLQQTVDRLIQTHFESPPSSPAGPPTGRPGS